MRFVLDPLAKALPLQGRTTFQGLQISIEQKKGSIRHWTDRTGKSGFTRMKAPYGYIRGSVGADGDHVDCYVGPHKDATHAYVIDQLAKPDYARLDEQKVILGVRTPEEAKALYLSHFDSPRGFGGMRAIPMEEFKRKVLATSKEHPLVKADGGGPFIGPRGGKWVDAAHTIPWHEGLARTGTLAAAVHTAIRNGSLPPVQKAEAPMTLQLAPRASFVFKALPAGAPYEHYRTHCWKCEAPFPWEQRSCEGCGRMRRHMIGSSREELGKGMQFQLTPSAERQDLVRQYLLFKSGPFIGPKGGKWADAAHTIPWTDKLPSWKKTASGYELPEHGARLEKVGKRWYLHHGGAIIPLSRKANFDSTERLIIARQGFQKSVGPGAGWEVIPNGKHGGYRKRAGKGYEYWYPSAHGHGQHPWDEDALASGKFDKDPGHWHALPGHWTAGGVDPHSQHPVKVVGQESRLYQVETPEVRPGWASLRDVHSGDTRQVSHAQIQAVEHGSGAPAPAGASQGLEGGKRTGWVAGSAQRLPSFLESTAKEGTALHAVEHGAYQTKIRRIFAEDADGVPRERDERQLAMPDGDKMRLLAEFEPLVRATAKSTLVRYKLPKSDEALADLHAAALEGILHAVERYDGTHSFAAQAQHYARQYARLHAAREFAGGFALPRRHTRMLPGFMAASGQAHKIHGREPTASEIAAVWDLKNRDVHEGAKGKDKPIPMVPYEMNGQPKPGKVQWAEQFLQFLEGQSHGKGSDWFEREPVHVLPGAAVGVMGAQDQAALKASLQPALDKLKKHDTVIGKFLYRTNGTALLDATLGLGQEPKSQRQIADTLPVYRLGRDGELKPMSPRAIFDLLPKITEHALVSARKHLGEEPAALLERAQHNLIKPENAAPGRTWNQELEYRAHGVSRADVQKWRSTMRARLRQLELRYQHEGDAERAGHARQARRHLDALGFKAARKQVVEHRLMTKPANAEWFRSAEALPVTVSDKGKAYGHTIMTMTDPATGAQKKVRVRSFKELDDLQKGGSTEKVDRAVLHLVSRYPRVAKLMYGSDDLSAMLPSAARQSVQKLIGCSEDTEMTKSEGSAPVGGPFIGPRGGKWVNAAHTIPWHAPDKAKFATSEEITETAKRLRMLHSEMEVKEDHDRRSVLCVIRDPRHGNIAVSTVRHPLNEKEAKQVVEGITREIKSRAGGTRRRIRAERDQDRE